MDKIMHTAQIALERMIQRALRSTRFTQDSPVLPDVWIAYGLRDGALDLLLTPNWQSGAIALAGALAARLRGGPPRADGSDPARAAAIASTQSTVAASLTLAELVWAALPLSAWWHEYLIEPSRGSPAGELLALWRDPAVQPRLRDALLAELDALAKPGTRVPRALDSGREITAQDRAARHITADLVWLAEVAGTLARLQAARAAGGSPLTTGTADAMMTELRAIRGSSADVLTAFFGLFTGVPTLSGPHASLWRVNRNREGTLAMFRSTAVVKADAARKVFGVRGAGVRWAVVDSGIDATHLAFRRRGPSGAVQRDWTKGTRVVATYDFSRARIRLSTQSADESGGIAAAFRAAGGETSPSAVPLSALHAVDWDGWEERLRIPHTTEGYVPPVNRHGTHVAGILAADWRPDDSPDDDLSPSLLSPQHDQPRTGVAPEVELYDIRVTDDTGKCDEFTVIAALQFIRAINARHEHLEIAGVNLSLSLLHHAANYACGRTPVCEECERLVASGVVAVAAAGNQGRAQYLTTDGELDEGYRSISITDPGNAASAITVGATHRSDPHGFGVSYFSSRGPTGDGRCKPDLVAPGEKVISTVPGNREEAMDGTSMAAPHVSGAAVLLLARHPELAGQPAEIKRILCSTTVDLDRERYFQGAGLLDILQALESV